MELTLKWQAIRSRGRSRMRRAEARFAWLTLMPALFFLAIFVGFPVVYAFSLSFHDWNLTSPTADWVGLANYEALAGDEVFIRSLRQTTIFTVAITACIIVLSLAIAMLLDLKLKFIALYRTVLYLPAVISMVAIGIVWVWMFDPQYGLINPDAPRHPGIEGPLWLKRIRTPRCWRSSLPRPGAMSAISRQFFWPACKVSTSPTTRRRGLTAPMPGTASGRSRCRCCAPQYCS